MRALGAPVHRRILLALASGRLATSPATVALGHTPVAGAVKEYPSSVNLSYRWGASTYPNWFRSSMATALESDWPARAFNNTRMPTFTYNSSGAGVR